MATPEVDLGLAKGDQAQEPKKISEVILGGIVEAGADFDLGLENENQVQEAKKVSEESLGGVVEVAAQDDLVVNLGLAIKGKDESQKQSWAQIVEDEEINVSAFVVSEIVGKKKVKVPKEVCCEAKPLWEYFVIE